MVISGKEYKIMNAHSGQVLDAKSENPIIQCPRQKNHTNQEWFFIRLDNDPGYWKISPTNGKCLECKEETELPRVQTSKWDGDGRETQKWALNEVKDGDCSCYTIENKAIHKIIVVRDASLNMEAEIVCCDWEPTENAKWFITPSE